MGSMIYANDIVGLQIDVFDDESAMTTCPGVDGSGFYSCNAVGRYLQLTKDLNESFTICDLTFYSEPNLISQVNGVW